MLRKQKETRDLLIRNIPIELHLSLEKAAREHHRSKTQEAIVVLRRGLVQPGSAIQKPTPFNWKQKIKGKFVRDAINEGRE